VACTYANSQKARRVKRLERQDNDDLSDDGLNHQQKNVPQLNFWRQHHELLRVIRSAPDKVIESA
jgi:hypothetical protein